MQICVIGCGYLGAVHAAGMAALGHTVIGLDIDPDLVDALASGRPHFFEPGLEDILAQQLASGRLTFTTEASLIGQARLVFIAVGTPQAPGHYGADLSYLDAAVEAIISHADDSAGPVVVAGKSTVPVGTAQAVGQRLGASGKDLLLTWNPEFLREGHGVADTLHPNRIVYGLPNGPAADTCREVLDECYAPLLAEGIPRLVTDQPTAELIKVAANSFLATKISFINAMAELCEASGANVSQLAEAIGLDERIGPQFLRAGIGFGGGCLPKDIRAFMARADELGVDEALSFLREVDAINLRQRRKVVDAAQRLIGGSFDHRRVAVLGAAFKPNSDDLRDSPALDIALQIFAQGADLRVTDPRAGDALRRKRPDLTVVDNVDEAIDQAELVLLLTEWPQYRRLDPDELITRVALPRIIDGRNALDPQRWQRAGWDYHGIGVNAPR